MKKRQWVDILTMQSEIIAHAVDILTMQSEILAQANAVDDERAFQEPMLRHRLRSAAAHLLLAFADLEMIGEDATRRNSQ